MKTVLIALGYDSNANKIAKAGHDLATKMGAKTVLLHIVEEQPNYAPMQYDPIMGSIGSFDYNVFTQVVDTKGYIDAAQYYLEKAKHHLKDEAIETIVKTGDSAIEILANAIRIKADLIVMGTHSKQWLEKILIGSVAESVLSQSKIPMLIIPTKK